MEKVTHISGIYQILNLKTNKFYIGSSYDLYERKHKHFSALKHNKHHSIHLQRSYNKYGIHCFKFFILEKCDISNLGFREQYYLDTLLKAKEYVLGKNKLFLKLGYNINPIVGSTQGRIFGKMSKNHKHKIRIAHLGKPKSKRAIKAFRLSKCKPIVQLTLNGGLVKHWHGCSFAAFKLGLDQDKIRLVCKGIRNKHGGFKWVFKSNFRSRKNNQTNNKNKVK